MVNVVVSNEGIPLEIVALDDFPVWLKHQPERIINGFHHTGFSGVGHRVILDTNGAIERAVVVCNDPSSVWAIATAAVELPTAQYRLLSDADYQTELALGWLLAQYQFTRYKAGAPKATLAVANDSILNEAVLLASGANLTRDLVNTPAADMMPEHLSETMAALAAEFNGQFTEIVGDELLTHNYPTIHMVGRASSHAPRLLDLRWGQADHPKLTIVGKGVCFDSGGLDLKPAAGMRLMKKDMGGAAHAIGLARLIMASGLPVSLRVLVPAVENAVSANAFRPGDVVTTRAGLTVEIDNTDAEGRLVLCDALAEADSEHPDLIVDFATLTGAARVALGLELPGFYSTDDGFAGKLKSAGERVEDPVWQLPLYSDYLDHIKGSISDLVNCAPMPFGGSITAALYLQQFVKSSSWVHFDVGAWNDRQRPGRPKGGEAMGLRATFEALKQQFSA